MKCPECGCDDIWDLDCDACLGTGIGVADQGCSVCDGNGYYVGQHECARCHHEFYASEAA